MIDPADVAERLAAVHERIVTAGGHDVSVLAVTKGFGPEAIEAAVAAGCRSIGENYAQELVGKRSAIEVPDPPEVHFIGQLQSNKVRMLTGLVDVYESVDRRSLADEVAKRHPHARILIQVDTADGAGAGKGGCAPARVEDLLDHGRQLGLRVEGLMTVGPTTGGPEAARPGFARLRELVDRFGLAVCSMGMTDDLEVAVAEGSTQVRVGTALFGPRPA